MTAVKEAQRIELEKKIKHHKALYYQGRPEISDHEFDRLEEELRQIHPESSVLTLIGTIVNSTGKVRHDSKMLSLGKTYKTEELKTWASNHEVVSTYKLDGVSGSLIYNNGKLKLGKTRGDGTFGEDMTAKAKWIPSIPHEIVIKNEIEIRGEIYITEENFFQLSDEMVTQGLERPASQRNIVAGLISRKENLELSRHLSFMAFDLIENSNSLQSEMEKIELLQKNGFETPEVTLHKDHTQLEEVIKNAEKFMSEGHYQIDGLVFTYNKLALHNEMGETAHHPRYKMAFKFKGESKVATINEIIWSVSRNGILTPVGDIEPIELSGAMISRVTLHNYGMVKQNNLKKGDRIEIIRSGEVIPKFLSVVEPSSEEFQIPETCSSCGEKTEIKDIRLFCTNPTCPGKIKEGILNFIQKIGIDDLSSKRLEEMIRAGLVKNISDLYKLKSEDLLKLDKVKDKLANKLIKSIEESKSVDLKTFLSALGISGGAYNKCEKVVHAGFNTIEKLKELTAEKLAEVDSFAEKSSSDFTNSLKEKMNLIDELLQDGFEFKESEAVSDSEFTGKKICITGALTEKRSVIETKIRSLGGIVVTSVTKNTDFLLTNETESNSSKFKKAKQLEIPIISETALLDS